MQGTRLKQGHDIFLDTTPNGAYGPTERDGNIIWYVKTPNGHIGDVSAHEITEHEDGTITVSPSILVSHATDMLWHGYLEKGIWREV